MYIKLRLASLAHVRGVGVAVHNHGRFVRVTADVSMIFVMQDTTEKNHRQRLPQAFPNCLPASSIHTPV